MPPASSTIRPTTTLSLRSVTSVFSYWSEMSADGSRIVCSRSRREKRLDAAVRSGPTPPPLPSKRWQAAQAAFVNAASPRARRRRS
jgi:hypothetical protein